MGSGGGRGHTLDTGVWTLWSGERRSEGRSGGGARGISQSQPGRSWTGALSKVTPHPSCGHLTQGSCLGSLCLPPPHVPVPPQASFWSPPQLPSPNARPPTPYAETEYAPDPPRSPREPFSRSNTRSSEKGSQAQARARGSKDPTLRCTLQASVPRFCLGVAFPAGSWLGPGLTLPPGLSLVIKPRKAGQIPPQRAQLCRAGTWRPRGETLGKGMGRQLGAAGCAPEVASSAQTVALSGGSHTLYLPTQCRVRRPGQSWPAAHLGPVLEAIHLATATSWLRLGEGTGAGCTVALGPPERTHNGLCRFTSSHRGVGGLRGSRTDQPGVPEAPGEAADGTRAAGSEPLLWQGCGWGSWPGRQGLADQKDTCGGSGLS